MELGAGRAPGIATDDASLHGKHCFATNGLMRGKVIAPFRLKEVRFERGICDHCGRVLACCCDVIDANGLVFTVGTGCVSRTGDNGLFRAYKDSPEVRAHKRAVTLAKDAKVVAEWDAINGDQAKVDRLMVAKTGDGEPWLQFARRAWSWCGMSGRARYLKQAKKILSAVQH